MISFLLCFLISATNIELYHNIKEMFEHDQQVREKCWETKEFQEVLKLDAENLPKIKEIINTFGWPGFSLVGEEGSHMMWLLVQHSDKDLPFQKNCLEQLKIAVALNEASKVDLAYLIDRVLVNEGKPQIYGTQMKIDNGVAYPHPIDDIENLAQRREEMGLCTFDDYYRVFMDMYKL